MDALYVIFFIIIIILLVSNRTSLSSKIAKLEQRIYDLQNMVHELNSKKPVFEERKAPPAADEPVSKPVVERSPEIPLPLPPKPREPTIEPRMEPAMEKTVKPPLVKHQPLSQPEDKQPRLSFFERYPDMEKFIGENLVNKIGIFILVLAIAFFVKYAIDNDWVGPAGRVGIGILCGGILVAIAHRLRKNYKAFSSVLVGGGIAVFYFTITLAYHQFHLFDQTASFIILIVITCFAVALSLLYDKQELAVIALVGGMSSPFMVSNGTANYNALFIYFIVLNAGLLIIAYYKAWRILNISAFSLTVIVLGGIVYTLPAGAYSTGFAYITVLYLMFFFINIANNIKENKLFIAADFSILLINTGLYFGTGLYLLTMMHDEVYRGLFSAALAAINLLLSFILFKTKKAEINILYLLIGITLTFISLTAPIQLHGHFITLFWSAECVVLYWLYQRSGIKLMRLTSLIIWCAMLLSLLLDWFQLYGYPETPLVIIANKGFITTLFSAVCTWLLYMLVDKQKGDRPLLIPDVYKYIAFILLFASGALEINHQFLNRYPSTNLNELYFGLYLPVFAYLFCLVTSYFKTVSWEVCAWLYAVTIFIYLLLIPQIFDLQQLMLTGNKIAAGHFAAHWAGAIFMLMVFWQFIFICKNNDMLYGKAISWLLAAAIVLFFSLEVCLLSNMLFYTRGASIGHLETLYVKTGLPVLWGIASFALMWLGMRYKTRVLRIISLVLFSITLIKLFVYDIENIPAAGKIAAFFCLGVLLLIISFMYQKVKVIITDDAANK